uniref:RNA-binding motif protein 17 n=1 Tax=Macrostomum lignano TaxID=282301 RepID=A0A1I8I9I1_9PLAT
MERAEPVAGVAKSIANDPTLSLGPDDNYNPFYPNEYDEDSKLPPVDQSSSSAQYPPFGKQSLAEKHNVSSAAAKMMAKMGYRHGQGLGREGQGMASALSVEKTSKRGGKIVSELDRYKNPSLVIMLTNMVGPGEVDDELEDEIKDECQKYGPVVLVTIFEFQRPNIPPEEAVRIFVEFERMDSAIKAMNELNGRFFGGRTVTCRFYDTEKFRDLELEGQPMPLELNE